MKDRYKQELKRKAFHLSAILFPITYFFLSRIEMMALMLIVASSAIYIDRNRHDQGLIQELVDHFFVNVMREHEMSGAFRLSGVSYMMAGFLITVVLFPKSVVIASWFILIICDSLAAIVGMRIGTPRNHGKSIEGAGAFFMSSLLIVMITFTIEPYNAKFSVLILACLITSLVEYFSHQIKLDDNLTIPVTFCSLICFLS